MNYTAGEQISIAEFEAMNNKSNEKNDAENDVNRLVRSVSFQDLKTCEINRRLPTRAASFEGFEKKKENFARRNTSSAANLYVSIVSEGNSTTENPTEVEVTGDVDMRGTRRPDPPRNLLQSHSESPDSASRRNLRSIMHEQAERKRQAIHLENLRLVEETQEEELVRFALERSMVETHSVRSARSLATSNDTEKEPTDMFSNRMHKGNYNLINASSRSLRSTRSHRDFEAEVERTETIVDTMRTSKRSLTTTSTSSRNLNNSSVRSLNSHTASQRGFETEVDRTESFVDTMRMSKRNLMNTSNRSLSSRRSSFSRAPVTPTHMQLVRPTASGSDKNLRQSRGGKNDNTPESSKGSKAGMTMGAPLTGSVSRINHVSPREDAVLEVAKQNLPPTQVELIEQVLRVSGVRQQETRRQCRRAVTPSSPSPRLRSRPESSSPERLRSTKRDISSEFDLEGASNYLSEEELNQILQALEHQGDNAEVPLGATPNTLTAPVGGALSEEEEAAIRRALQEADDKEEEKSIQLALRIAQEENAFEQQQLQTSPARMQRNTAPITPRSTERAERVGAYSLNSPPIRHPLDDRPEGQQAASGYRMNSRV